MSGRILINGEPSNGLIPVTDSSVLRGDGCFEVMRSYQGRPFGVDEHLDRLRRSAAALDIDLPSRADLAAWVAEMAGENGDCLVRVVVTRGSALPGPAEPARVIVFAHSMPELGDTLRLFPVTAPWHAGGIQWDLAGAKILSYAPNLSASRRAKAEGADDALLLTTDGHVLEGPTFSVAWVTDGVLETPRLDLGILDSITRRVVLEEAQRIGLEVVEGIWEIEHLSAASEMMAMSTVREVQAVSSLGDLDFEPGDVTKHLSDAYSLIVR